MTWALTIAGAVLEFVGVLLVASPELSPRARHLRSSIRIRVDSIRARLSRLRRRSGATQATIEPAVEHDTALPLTAVKRPPAGESIERTVERLINLSTEIQSRVAAVERGLEGQPGRWRRDIERSKGEMETLMDRKVEAAADAHIEIRLWGIVLLLAGVPLLAWANLLD